MPKVEKIKDSRDALPPLRITRRKERRVSSRRVISPRIRVKCGCCAEAVDIFFQDPPTGSTHFDTLEINGVSGTVGQWRQVLLPLLGMGLLGVEIPKS